MKHAFRATLTGAVAIALAMGGPAATAQAASQPKTAQPQSGEKTVEEAYLQSSAETMMVK